MAVVHVEAELERLNAAHARPGAVSFARHPMGGIVSHLTTPAASAIVALHGAHVLSFKPTSGGEVLWMSPEARIEPGGGIRGGIPVCWPWFATHATDPSKPDHGYVRKSIWDVVQATSEPNVTSIELTFPTAPQHKALWHGDVDLRVLVTLRGGVLRVDLNTRNVGAAPLELTQALHTYFAVGNIANVSVAGLSNRIYQDKLQNYARVAQEGDITFTGEVDRIYEDAPDDVIIADPDNARRIRIAKEGSTSTVVWNPWIEKSARISHMPPESYRGMVCVETANAGGDVVRLGPSQQHRLSTILSVEPI